MDCKEAEENGMRSKSFRHEDSSNRRLFLRSYPLQWREEEKISDEVIVKVKNEKTEQTHIKKIILSAFQWGEEKVLILRRFKNKLTIYVITCITISFKRPTALIPGA